MTSKKIVLKFPIKVVNEPIIYKLAKDYDLEFNILKANIKPDEEGILVLELRGKKESFDKGLEYLKKLNIVIQPLKKDIVRNEKSCTHCGACVTICPTGAFSVDKKNRKIIFNEEKCIACEICISACPMRAMAIHF
ncbi:MAG: Ferredoxin-2 [Elusimicrobia bacterium ADurb.Bin231]|nr:MAG: Ferredoxin-2 [Elusimicrobia bacterium ADurb.Bin231]